MEQHDLRVGDLRKKLEGVPDDTRVKLSNAHEYIVKGAWMGNKHFFISVSHNIEYDD